MNFFTLALLGLFCGILLTWIFEFAIKSNKKLYKRYYKQHEVVFGYHIHHSTYGLVALVMSIVLCLDERYSQAIFWLGVGVGIILEHTASERRFIFVNKWKKR